MRLAAYLLLFFLLLLSSGSTCEATSRNHRRLFFHGGGGFDVVAPVPSPVIHGHGGIVKDLFYEHVNDDAHDPFYRMTGAMMPPAPPPLLPGVEDVLPRDTEISVPMTTAPSPSPSPSSPPPQVIDNGGELGGGGNVSFSDGDGEGGIGPPSEATATEHGIVLDYIEPMTHPPSHN